MSEPLSSPEIEDVVSSVRRLVSTTHSPRVKTRDLSHDKLMLTPSLRVVPEPQAEPVAAAEVSEAEAERAEAEAAVVEAEAPGMAAVETGVSETEVSETEVSETGMAAPELATPEPPVVEAEVSEAVAAAAAKMFAAEIVAAVVAEMSVADAADEVVSEVTPEAPYIHVETEDTAPDGVLHALDAEWEDELWTETEAPLAEIAAAVEDAELVLAPDPVAETELVAEPEQVAEPELAEEPLLATDPGADALAASWSEAGAEAGEWAAGEADWVEEAPIPFVPLHHRAAAAGSAFAADGAAPVAEAAQVVEDQAKAPDLVAAAGADEALSAAPSPEPEPEAEVEAEPTLFADDGAGVVLLDEAALNEIVRKLIREELQGALGERITRNVRKLVRAEINRALAAQAFD